MTAGEYELTGLQRTYLEEVRKRITPDDMPDPYEFAVELDADYNVVRTVPVSLESQLAGLIARWVAEEGL